MPPQGKCICTLRCILIQVVEPHGVRRHSICNLEKDELWKIRIVSIVGTRCLCHRSTRSFTLKPVRARYARTGFFYFRASFLTTRLKPVTPHLPAPCRSHTCPPAAKRPSVVVLRAPRRAFHGVPEACAKLWGNQAANCFALADLFSAFRPGYHCSNSPVAYRRGFASGPTAPRCGHLSTTVAGRLPKRLPTTRTQRELRWPGKQGFRQAELPQSVCDYPHDIRAWHRTDFCAKPG